MGLQKCGMDKAGGHRIPHTVQGVGRLGFSVGHSVHIRNALVARALS